MNRTQLMQPSPQTDADRRRAFSLIELLVVVAIIIALVGLLLVALRGAQNSAREAKSSSTMNAFANAAMQFQQEHQRFPGLLPDEVLAEIPELTTTQNALFELMGGAMAYHPILRQRNFDEYEAFKALGGSEPEVSVGSTGWVFVYNPDRFGEGPMINGKVYEPYLSVDDNVVRLAEGRLADGSDTGFESRYPDLIDAWGQPIIYFRRLSPTGVLISEDPSDRPQFLFAGFDQYLESPELGELGRDQRPTGGQIEHSIFNSMTGMSMPAATLAQLIRNAAIGEPDQPLTGSARGGFVLISAGEDGIFFSVTDGPGTRDAPVDDILTGENANPKVAEDYDDIRIFGGS